jgi:hypothetical protein
MRKGKSLLLVITGIYKQENRKHPLLPRYKFLNLSLYFKLK